MTKKEKQTVVLFNPMPVKHQVAIVNKKTTSLQVPLVNIPLSLLAIARMVSEDFDVRIINAVVDTNYEELILDACEGALCFGVSSMTCYQIRDGMNVSAAVKERYPDMPIIWGGYHPSTQPEQTLQDPDIDIVVIGQGELTFKEVVGRLAKGQSFDGVPGVAYKDGGRIITNSPRGFTDLNEFPAIPYDMVDVEAHIKGYKFGERCLDYYISQGCAAGCSFCSEPIFCGRKWTGLEPETVVAELEHLAKTYNVDTFMIRDSDFFINVSKLKELCNLLIDKDLGLRLTSVNGRMEQLHRMDDEVWALARKAGVREVFIGVHSWWEFRVLIRERKSSLHLRRFMRLYLFMANKGNLIKWMCCFHSSRRTRILRFIRRLLSVGCQFLRLLGTGATLTRWTLRRRGCHRNIMILL
jgi:radical SAM superfamily enzyme YgiQ (UPF0313 family)